MIYLSFSDILVQLDEELCDCFVAVANIETGAACLMLLLALILVVCAVKLRHVRDQFSIRGELISTAICSIITMGPYAVLRFLGERTNVGVETSLGVLCLLLL